MRQRVEMVGYALPANPLYGLFSYHFKPDRMYDGARFKRLLVRALPKARPATGRRVTPPAECASESRWLVTRFPLIHSTGFSAIILSRTECMMAHGSSGCLSERCRKHGPRPEGA